MQKTTSVMQSAEPQAARFAEAGGGQPSREEFERSRSSPRVLRVADFGLGALLLFAVVFGPWAFGTTEPWSVRILTGVGLAGWGMVLLKGLLGQIGRWQHREEAPRHRSPGRWLERFLGLLTGLVLAYCFLSAWNARATYHPEGWHLEYHASIAWLPHSYDRASSWKAFWVYLGVGGLFWAARSWILSGAEAERRRARRRARGEERPGNALLPERLRLLLWVLSLNGALLALEGIIQRLAGCNRLLGLVEPAINKDVLSQFGPYAYRANAAQYFNLLWPVTLGLWWTYQQARRSQGLAQVGGQGKGHHLLLSCALLMALCPVLSTSRGGAIIMVAGAVLAATVLLMAQWRSTWAAKLAVFGLLGAMVGGGLLLGWEELGPRLEMIQQGVAGREALFITGRRMADAEPFYGTGPGTFSSLYQLFRRSSVDYWPAQQHNDWLETLITFGWAGTALLVLGLVLVVGRWFLRGRVYGERHFVMLVWIALGGCLLHACYDFPFQVHSLLTLFVLLCAVLSCLSRRGA